MKTTKTLALIAASALALSACGADTANEASDDTDQLVEVDVGIVNLPIFAPIYVADAKGYFEDEGLSINLENVQSGSEAVPLAASGNLDVVAAGFSAGLFSALETGLEISIVGSMGVSDGDADNSPTELIVSKELYDSGEITSVADLAGANMGAAGGEGATGAFLMSLALEEEGMTLDDVVLENVGNPDMPTAIENGSLDGGLISAPFSHRMLNDQTGVSLAVPPEGTSGTGLIYGDEFSESAEAQAFFNALVRASADLQGEDRYSDENIEILAEATGQTAEEVRQVPLYTWLPNLAPLPDQLQKMESVWMEAGALEYSDPLDPADYVDASFAENAE